MCLDYSVAANANLCKNLHMAPLNQMSKLLAQKHAIHHVKHIFKWTHASENNINHSFMSKTYFPFPFDSFLIRYHSILPQGMWKHSLLKLTGIFYKFCMLCPSPAHWPQKTQREKKQPSCWAPTHTAEVFFFLPSILSPYFSLWLILHCTVFL